MQTILSFLCSLVIVFIIISPFFWLRFLKKYGKWIYILFSSIVTILFLIFFTYWGDDYISDWLASRPDSDSYYFYYDVGFHSALLAHFLIIISPIIFTKILFEKLTVKSFFIALVLSILIFVGYAYAFIYILWPKAASSLLKYI